MKGRWESLEIGNLLNILMNCILGYSCMHGLIILPMIIMQRKISSYQYTSWLHVSCVSNRRQFFKRISAESRLINLSSNGSFIHEQGRRVITVMKFQRFGQSFLWIDQYGISNEFLLGYPYWYWWISRGLANNWSFVESRCSTKTYVVSFINMIHMTWVISDTFHSIDLGIG